MKNFLWINLVCRFGILHEIITNNETQFERCKVQWLCKELKIKHHFSMSAYPQGMDKQRLAIEPLLGLQEKIGKKNGGSTNYQ